MLSRLTFTVALVLMCGGAAGRVTVPRDYGVKLCGREFIRAVIFTCGGSRWRRSADADYLDPFQVTNSDITEGDDQLTWQDGVEPATHKRSPPQISSSSSFSSSLSSYSLADLLALFGALGDGGQDRLAGDFQQPAIAGQQGANKRKRNFSLGVAGMCCSQGCTKNDIGRLC